MKMVLLKQAGCQMVMIGITMIKMEINAQVGFMLKINGIY